ncbi:MAG: hypothetical protein ACOC49_03765, partial [Candidatus Bipolaricaulota bacterium]
MTHRRTRPISSNRDGRSTNRYRALDRHGLIRDGTCACIMGTIRIVRGTGRGPTATAAYDRALAAANV